MKIGIDIDDTTVNLMKPMLKYAEVFDVEVLKGKGNNGKLGLISNRYYLEALYGWSKEEKYRFFDCYYKKVLEECQVLEKASEIIQKLKQEGNHIVFITARLINIPNCDTQTITKTMLNQNHIPYDKLIMNAKNKLEFYQENGIEIFIEDSYETCQELEKNGMKTFLMTTKMNEALDTKQIERVRNWKEVYEKIHKFIAC